MTGVGVGNDGAEKRGTTHGEFWNDRGEVGRKGAGSRQPLIASARRHIAFADGIWRKGAKAGETESDNRANN